MGCSVSNNNPSQCQSSRRPDNNTAMILLPNGANMPSIGYGSWMTLLLGFSALLVICLPAAIAVDCNVPKSSQCQLLPNGARLPAVGYGTWMSQDDALEKGLEAAFEAGYRHFDTAAAYQNEKTIGNLLKKWLNNGKIKRDELFITTKLPPSGNRASDVEKFFNKSLEDLQLDYIDLYLVHVPFTFKLVEGDLHPTDEDGNVMLDKTTDHIAVWKEMEKLVDSGRAKSIGLSNFNQKQIKRVLDNARIPPANLQVELHIHLQQNELVKFCKEHNITVTAYSPLGSPGLIANSNSGNSGQSPPSLLKTPEVIEIANNHNKTAAQVILRYTVQRGIAVIPKSVTPSRIKENIDIFDFELTAEEMKKLQSLDLGEEGRLLKFDFFKGLKDHPEFPFQ